MYSDDSVTFDLCCMRSLTFDGSFLYFDLYCMRTLTFDGSLTPGACVL